MATPQEEAILRSLGLDPSLLSGTAEVTQSDPPQAAATVKPSDLQRLLSERDELATRETTVDADVPIAASLGAGLVDSINNILAARLPRRFARSNVAGQQNLAARRKADRQTALNQQKLQQELAFKTSDIARESAKEAAEATRAFTLERDELSFERGLIAQQLGFANEKELAEFKADADMNRAKLQASTSKEITYARLLSEERAKQLELDFAMKEAARQRLETMQSDMLAARAELQQAMAENPDQIDPAAIRNRFYGQLEIQFPEDSTDPNDIAGRARALRMFDNTINAELAEFESRRVTGQPLGPIESLIHATPLGDAISGFERQTGVNPLDAASNPIGTALRSLLGAQRPSESR
jgi:hypothetical protein